MPRVSVVIPTFGRPALVVRAVRSVLAQTVRDIEVLVVIDGADPDTVAALAQVDDPRLRVIEREGKGGAGLARDSGADAAAGEWVAFLDDDDEWLPEKLERQLAIAPADGRAVVTTLFRVVTALGDRISPALPYDGRQQIDEWLFGRQTWLKGHEAMIQTSSLMVPRFLFNTLHFRDTAQHEEWEICIRAVKTLGYSFLTVPEPLVIYYAPQAGASLSKTYTLERSMAWADAVGDLLSPRAYSGFALTVASQVPSTGPRGPAMLGLVRAAFRKGAPTARQLFAFALIWGTPHGLRRRLRALKRGSA
jgi:glycosyltransferase involved in cell wall biosynthesis